jgi:SWI/SNF related-matrix-associated actin-dependent regulator of chromatin subfamily C
LYSGSKTNVGAIAGGVGGGVALLLAGVLVALFFLRRRRLHNKPKERPDLLTGPDEGDDHTGAAHNELPQFYQPEPFMVNDPTVGDRTSVGGLTADGRTDSNGRPISILTSDTRSATPDPSTSFSGRTGKSAPMRQMRPVNIIQHADAGPSMAPPGEDEPETVELPPAYTNIRKDLTHPSQSDLQSAPLLEAGPAPRETDAATHHAPAS